MKINRAGEAGQPPPRSSRIFNMESYWYFATREGADIGPYNSREAADNGLHDFIQFLRLASQQTMKSFLSTLTMPSTDNGAI